MVSHELEQAIMDCWGVVDDIDIIYHAHGEINDDVANVLLGTKALYELKFQKLFSIYERELRRQHDEQSITDWLNGTDHVVDHTFDGE